MVALFFNIKSALNCLFSKIYIAYLYFVLLLMAKCDEETECEIIIGGMARHHPSMADRASITRLK